MAARLPLDAAVDKSHVPTVFPDKQRPLAVAGSLGVGLQRHYACIDRSAICSEPDQLRHAIP